MWVGGYYHYVFICNRQIFLTEELNKHDVQEDQRSSYTIVYRSSFACCAVERHVCWCCIHHHTYPVVSYVVSILYENRITVTSSIYAGSRWKIKINKLGPCMAIASCDEEGGREEQSLPTFDLQWHVSSVVHGYKYQCLFAPLHFCPGAFNWNVSKFFSELKLVTDNLSLHSKQTGRSGIMVCDLCQTSQAQCAGRPCHHVGTECHYEDTTRGYNMRARHDGTTCVHKMHAQKLWAWARAKN